MQGLPGAGHLVSNILASRAVFCPYRITFDKTFKVALLHLGESAIRALWCFSLELEGKILTLRNNQKLMEESHDFLRTSFGYN